jgi:hypothetical protein
MTDNNVVTMMQSPPKLLEQAIASGASIEVIERLLAMQERWEATQARKAFNTAIAAFKSNPPAILKTVEVGYDGRGGSRTSYKHEDLAELLAVVDPALAAHGLWVRFKIDSTDKVTVICIIGHVDGYSEEASKLSAAPDTSGSKNSIQAIGSTVSYLQRYTLKTMMVLLPASAAIAAISLPTSRPITSARCCSIIRISKWRSFWNWPAHRASPISWP